VSREYRDGRRDGLREALAVLEAEESKWAEKMKRYRSGRTFQAQRIRHKAFQVAQTRVRTALHRREKEDRQRGDDIHAGLNGALKRLRL
jgi:glutamyl-tRNA reductase